MIRKILKINAFEKKNQQQCFTPEIISLRIIHLVVSSFMKEVISFTELHLYNVTEATRGQDAHNNA